MAMAFAAAVYETNRDFLWGLCYRMTGNAADADDLVQETFIRALEKPPRDTDEPLRPWLVRVAINLSRDLLRRRRRRGYVGPWLPSPVPTDDAESLPSYEPPAPAEESPAARYDLLESDSLAFLLALEALTPAQRAVLLLRDVFDYSTAETAAALGLTEANAKVTLHRARRAMREYDKDRAQPATLRRELTGRALEQFLAYLGAGDAQGLERLLTEDVRTLNDGGGEVGAALNPIRGRRNVIRLLTSLTERYRGSLQLSFRLLNGLPAVLVERAGAGPKEAARYTVHCEVDSAGRIKQLLFVLAPSKLSAVR